MLKSYETNLAAEGYLSEGYLFESSYDDKHLREHCLGQHQEMKILIKLEKECLGRLLKGVPDRLGTGRSLVTRDTAATACIGLLVKYQFEYRRPYPKDGMINGDTWMHLVLRGPLTAVSADANFFVGVFFLGDTATSLGDAVGWQRGQTSKLDGHSLGRHG